MPKKFWGSLASSWRRCCCGRQRVDDGEEEKEEKGNTDDDGRKTTTRGRRDARPRLSLDDHVPPPGAKLEFQRLLDELQQRPQSSSSSSYPVDDTLSRRIAQLFAFIDDKQRTDPCLPDFSIRGGENYYDNDSSAHGRKQVARIFFPERTTSGAAALLLFLEKEEDEKRGGDGIGGSSSSSETAPSPAPSVVPPSISSQRRRSVVSSEEAEGKSSSSSGGRWDFDGGGGGGGGRRTEDPLYVVAADAFAERDGELRRALRADADAVERFLRALPRAHLDAPFHNTCHVAHVLNGMRLFLERMDCALPAFVRACCVLAAAAHDIGHVGLTNDFLVRSLHPFALASNDVSPQENHSLRRFFELAAETGLLAGLAPGELRLLRRLVIGMVLATDMKAHFKLYRDFGNAFRGVDLMGSDLECYDFARDVDFASAARRRPPSPRNEDELLLLLQMTLKCADMSHMFADATCMDAAVASLQEEVYRQGDRERVLFGRVITMGADRRGGVSLLCRQPEFMEVFVLPMFAMFASVFPGCVLAYSRTFDNYVRYKARARQASARMDYYRLCRHSS